MTEGCVLDVQSLRHQDFFVFNRMLPEMENLASKDSSIKSYLQWDHWIKRLLLF